MTKTVALEVTNANFVRPLKAVENQIKELLVQGGYSIVESPETADIVLIVSAQEGSIDWLGGVFDNQLAVGISHNVFCQDRDTAHGYHVFRFGKFCGSGGGWPGHHGKHYEVGWFERGVVACFEEIVRKFKV